VKYEPQLATLVKAPPSGDGWLHEIKFDGYRIGCHVRGGRVTLTSRNGKDWTAAFPDLIEAARALKVDEALLDGEVAAVLPDGRTSFQALQGGGRSSVTLSTSSSICCI
jgi:bifunctional non-homologous end joining protein LigD